MANRPRAHVNLVAEELLYYLNLIGKPEAPKWLTTPKTVEMMTGPGDLKKARPGLFLEVHTVRPDPNRKVMGPPQSEQVIFLVHCTVEDVLDPSGACHDLMADVARQVLENRQLDQGNGLLGSGGLTVGERKASIEAAEGGAGFAVGFVEVFASYLTSNAAP